MSLFLLPKTGESGSKIPASIGEAAATTNRCADISDVPMIKCLSDETGQPFCMQLKDEIPVIKTKSA